MKRSTMQTPEENYMEQLGPPAPPPTFFFEVAGPGDFYELRIQRESGVDPISGFISIYFDDVAFTALDISGDGQTPLFLAALPVANILTLSDAPTTVKIPFQSKLIVSGTFTGALGDKVHYSIVYGKEV